MTRPRTAIAQIAAWVKRKTMKSGKQKLSAAVATKAMAAKAMVIGGRMVATIGPNRTNWERRHEAQAMRVRRARPRKLDRGTVRYPGHRRRLPRSQCRQMGPGQRGLPDRS